MKTLYSRLFACICLVVMPELLDVSLVFAGNLDVKSGQSSLDVNRRRRKKGLFDEMEIFKNNLDVFAGPSIHSGSGDYLGALTEGMKAPQTNFESRGSVDAGFISAVAGIQYRIIPGHKDKGITSLLSYAAGLSYQRRGYSYEFEKRRIGVDAKYVNDNVLIKEKVRANYINVPLSVRFGRRLFIEAGLSLDFLLSGKSDFYLERAMAPSDNSNGNDGVTDFYVIHERVSKLDKVLPFVSPGFQVSGGLNFNENLGFRMAGNFNRAFFKSGVSPDDTNFGSSIFSIQLIGCIN